MIREISLSKLEREAVVIEKQQEFNNSVFGLVYQKAEILLQNIIRENKKYSEAGKSVQREIENLISFEGRRGTGKTSAMLSVQKALKNYKNNMFLKKDEEFKEVSFHVLDVIDASSLEDGEDILELVLANMFSDLRKAEQKRDIQERNRIENAELYQLFEQIFGSLLTLKKGQKRNENSSPLYELTRVSNSQTLLAKIRELIPKYLQYMNRTDYYCTYENNRFLVITIDDLDMHFTSKEHASYDMLETIHRYLMIPNVIVLVSYSYRDLCRACERHYEELYYSRTSDEKDYRHIQELAIQYLNKVCPIYSTIHMPSIRKKDYQKREDIKVLVSRQEGEKVLENFTGILWPGKEEKEIKLSVKKFLLLLKASCGDLYYDAVGGKKHFVEPENLRSLSQTYTFFRQLDKIKEVNGETSGQIEQAMFKELLDDLYFRFAIEKLTRDDYEDFKSFLDVTIERRSRDIVGDIRRRIISENPEHHLSEITYVGSKKNLSYSYGELLYGIYVASSEHHYSKELVWCLLDSYTIMLTQMYRQLKYAVDYEIIQKNKDRLLKIIGTSVSSSWSNKFVPAIRLVNERTEDAEPGRAYYDYTVQRRDDGIVAMGAVKYTLVEGKWEFELEENGYSPAFVNQFKILEVLLMFFSGVCGSRNRQEGFDVQYIPGRLDPESLLNKAKKNQIQSPKLVFRFSDACFNIMNFVGNSFGSEEFFSSARKMLEEAYLHYLDDLHRMQKIDSSDIPKTKSGLISMYSLKSEYDRWKKITYGFAMPMYSFDMMYNIFKRRYQQQAEMPKAVAPNKYWSYVKSVYEDFGHLLGKQDEFYYEASKERKKSYRFQNAFMECPYIKFINELENDK